MTNNYNRIPIKTKVLNVFRNIYKINFLENWLLSKTINQTADNFFVRLIPPNYTYNSKTIRQAKRDGIDYNLDLSDYVEHFIYWGIKDEGHELLYSKIKKGMTVFDIGANIGDTSLHFSNLVGDTGKVFSFEPDPANFKKLTTNIQLNNFTNITTFNIGLGNQQSMMKLYKIDPGNMGRNRMFLSAQQDSDFVEVKIEKMDELLKKLNNPKIDFMKIDVEGFEMQVLFGASEYLNQLKPKLYIELNDSILKVNNSSAKELLNFLFEKSYKIKVAQTGEILNPDSNNFGDDHFDILCE